MYEIVDIKPLNSNNIFLMEVVCPWVACSGQAGQFVIVIPKQNGERIPLTISDIIPERESIIMVFQVVGESTRILSEMKVGESLYAVVGPLGNASELIERQKQGKVKRVMFVGGGVGIAPIFPQVKWASANGVQMDVVVGARNKDLLFYLDQLRSLTPNIHVMTDDGSMGEKGLVTQKVEQLILEKGVETYSHCVAIGPLMMMKFVALTTKKYSLPTITSLNCMMVDGTGMCGACRVRVGEKVMFTCVDGPEFDGHQVDFDDAARKLARPDAKRYHIATASEEHHCNLADVVEQTLSQNEGENTGVGERKNPRQHPIEQKAEVRRHNFEEVSSTFTFEQAQKEATRCLQCKKPQCVAHCPVSIKIPQFIHAIKEGEIGEAYRIISEDSALPSVCGRVCPQENQCEGACILGVKGEPVAIGALERMVADTFISQKKDIPTATPAGKKVAVIGSGPSGLTCAGDLAKRGYSVTIFEALHHAGGVLVYGIPEFRLPKQRIVANEIEGLRRLGVKIETNVIVGKSVTIEQLMEEKGFEAVYIASGAGLPKFMNVKGETLFGVLSANELLTRTNLMHGYSEHYDTPITLGKRVLVVGGGNVAMDAARTALRLGSDVTVVYRRGLEDMPARKEEVQHAIEEGVRFEFQKAPVEVLDDGNGNVAALRCISMAMGEVDAKGRRTFHAIEGSEMDIAVDTIVVALGTSPNPLIKNTTANLDVETWGGIKTDEDGRTSRRGIFAGGDAVSGAATVILAMGAGRKAAQSIAKYLEK